MIFLWSVPGLFQMENGKRSDFVFVFLNSGWWSAPLRLWKAVLQLVPPMKR